MSIWVSEPEQIADMACRIGEGPVWHPDEGRLYYVDIPRGRLLWHDPASGKNGTAWEGEELGGCTLQADGGLALFTAGCGIKLLGRTGVRSVIDGIPEEAGTRFNDEIADSRGRVFVGTMSAAGRSGRLYQILTDGSYRVASDGADTPEGGYGTPNGMGFTPDEKAMYFNDSRTNRTYLFSYNEETGALSDRILFREGSAPSRAVPDLNGRGDGLTVDAAGRVWMGEWDGGRVVCYGTSDGSLNGKPELLLEIPMPAKKITCVTFGGPDYTDLFVTTALFEGTKDSEGPGAGALYRIRTNVQGAGEHRSRLLL
ncbi:MAG: SMP-30/gluconolactonase/LRE family protein [Spirochaetales bacterium]|nr:SMP-30/gluconolactonase/LRE family protein [Spirochaetales bacterium]